LTKGGKEGQRTLSLLQKKGGHLLNKNDLRDGWRGEKTRATSSYFDVRVKAAVRAKKKPDQGPPGHCFQRRPSPSKQRVVHGKTKGVSENPKDRNRKKLGNGIVYFPVERFDT